ncbi:MlaD family protein [Syntrophus aciditrophicus]|mgnify:CR=1 FL=1|uniref:ABC-type transport system involved in resistance to organic solvents, periplasmic component n=1 Tax=Syntrophus aciditrophicus (strain SB) TaxID=56780 RepID=Q2LS06_SYNAS|nr:MlaD family protein [Syntrophus aciditrophicus]ABC76868.1 ABC-type transport system involved in resistance to organic solvents, periplasmic component [Syntrophus aciditrophicus SB]
MTAISSEAKVGLFVLVGLIILGYMSFRVGQQGFGLKKGYRVEVAFDNVSGLEKDASVQIAGVEMGRVESIRLKDGKAMVTLRINPDVKLERDVMASIKTHGVLGDKYIELSPGTKGEGYIAPGGQIAVAERAADIDRLLQQFALIADDVKAVSGALSKVLGGQAGEESIGAIIENTRQLTCNLNKVVLNNEENLRTMLENTRELTGNLNSMVTRNDENVTQMIESLKSASREMEKTFAALSDISEGMKRGEGTMGQLLTDKTMAEKLNRTMTSLESVAEKIDQGKGTIGKLVNEQETVDNLNESLGGINRYVNKAEQFRTFLSYRGEYLFDKSDAKSYLDVRIQPRHDRFYVLGLVNDPRGRRTVKDTTVNGVTTRTEEWDKSELLFNAQLGKRFRNVVLRGGLFESTGGVGIDYLTLNDNLKLTFEAFDFSDDRDAHLKGYAEYRLFKHLYLTAGWDDFISDEGNRSPFAGLAIRFEDDDLKYLLTSTPIPR